MNNDFRGFRVGDPTTIRVAVHQYEAEIVGMDDGVSVVAKISAGCASPFGKLPEGWISCSGKSVVELRDNFREALQDHAATD